MREQSLIDGWGSYYTIGTTCHLLPVACLPLPLVSFYGSDYRVDAWTYSSPRVPHQPYETRACRQLDVELSQEASISSIKTECR